jgi:hypothetical protein
MKASCSAKRLFPSIPQVNFLSKVNCDKCGIRLKMRKSGIKRIATLPIGEIDARELHMYCGPCGIIYRSNELEKLVPTQAKFGFDIIVEIGMALFVNSQPDALIQKNLAEKNITISIREVGYLGKKFIIYLALAHRESQAEIKKLMNNNGGYILHLDATCEGASPHLMSAIDDLSRIVLNNIKMPSENKDQIIPFLREVKESYGEPVALVHDMGVGILKSVKEVFPNVRDFICHFHFLKDIGKDLFGDEHSVLFNGLKRYRVRTKLRETKNKLEKMISENEILKNALNTYLSSVNLDGPKKNLPPTIIVYVLIVWVLESNSELKGFGFPFDRPHLVFYKRLEEASVVINSLEKRKEFQKKLGSLATCIHKTLDDRKLKMAEESMQKKIKIFDQLRDAMRIALPENKLGLNDDGNDEVNMKTIKDEVTKFRNSKEVIQLALKDVTYKKMLKQIDKYWDKLFADPIEVKTSAGIIKIHPQRTNNLMERFFRDFKRTQRKKGGANSLSKAMKAMIADTPLVKNLENEKYMNIILNGKKTLAERFSDVDIMLVREDLLEKQKLQQLLPANMRKACKLPHLASKLAHFIERRLAS